MGRGPTNLEQPHALAPYLHLQRVQHVPRPRRPPPPDDGVLAQRAVARARHVAEHPVEAQRPQLAVGPVARVERGDHRARRGGVGALQPVVERDRTAERGVVTPDHAAAAARHLDQLQALRPGRGAHVEHVVIRPRHQQQRRKHRGRLLSVERAALLLPVEELVVAVRRGPLRRRRLRGDRAGAGWLIAAVAAAIAVRRQWRRLRGSIELPDAGARPWERPLVRIGQQRDESLEGARSERCSVAHAHVEGQRRLQRRGEGGPLLVGDDPLLPVVGLEGREARRRRGGRSRRRGGQLHELAAARSSEPRSWPSSRRRHQSAQRRGKTRKRGFKAHCILVSQRA